MRTLFIVGIVDVEWNLIDDSGKRYTGDRIESTWTVTFRMLGSRDEETGQTILPSHDSVRSQSLTHFLNLTTSRVASRETARVKSTELPVFIDILTGSRLQQGVLPSHSPPSVGDPSPTRPRPRLQLQPHLPPSSSSAPPSPTQFDLKHFLP